MLRKRVVIGIALIGFTLSMASNAWGDRDRGDRGHRRDKGYHHSYKTPQGHHYGWVKGKGNPHRDRYDHRGEYRYRDRDHRWNRDRNHRWDRDRQRHRHYRDRDHYRRDRHYRSHARHDSRFRLGISIFR